MVSRKSNLVRNGKGFVNYTNFLRRELEPIAKRKITNSEITDNIASFLDKENLTPIILRRAKRKKGGLF